MIRTWNSRGRAPVRIQSRGGHRPADHHPDSARIGATRSLEFWRGSAAVNASNTTRPCVGIRTEPDRYFADGFAHAGR